MSWPTIALKEETSLITKGTTPTSVGHAYTDRGVPFVRAQNLVGGTVSVEADPLFISLDTNDALKRSQIQPNDVLISIAGTIGRAAIVPSDATKMNCNQAVAIVRPSDKVDRKFLQYWLSSNDALSQMSKGKVTGVISNLSLGQIGQLEIPLPPLEVQRRIAAILDQADALRRLRLRALDRLNTLGQAIFHDMFGNLDMRSLELGELANLKRGPFGGALKKDIFVPEGYQVYEQSHAISKNPFHGRYFIDKIKFNEMKGFEIRTEDLIVSCSGTLGRVLRIPVNAPRGVINQALLRIRPNQDLIRPAFLEAFLETSQLKNFLSGFSRGTGLQNFPPMTEVRKIPVPTPSLELQDTFIERIASVGNCSEVMHRGLMSLEKSFVSLQHGAFRGEL